MRHLVRFPSPVTLNALAYATVFCILITLSTSPSLTWAQGADTATELTQSPAKSPDLGSAKKNAGASKVNANPKWQDLTPAQQLSLKPLAANWNSLNEARKQKWIAIAAGYARLSPEGQSELHSRMTEWASLNQQQRDQARLNFAKSKQLTSHQKTATWEAYQALSPEERKKLAISAPPKPPGAAPAIIPLVPKKLAAVPLLKETSLPMPKTSAPNPALNPKTLLPLSRRSDAPAPALKQ